MATHGRKGHSLKTVIKCDRQRALRPDLPILFWVRGPAQSRHSRAWLSLQIAQFPFQLSSVQSTHSHIHISHTKVVQVPRGFARVPRCTRYSHSVSISACACSCSSSSVCTGTCVRATSQSPSPSSSSSTWPPAASPSRSLGRRRRRRPYRILDFMFATFATSPLPLPSLSRLRQHFMLITRLIRSVCLASPRLAPCVSAMCEVEALHRLIQLPFALLAFNLEMGEL